MKKRIIIIGAGGHAKSVSSVVIDSGNKLIGFLDDNISIGTEIIHSKSIKVIGKVEDCVNYKDCEFIICVGSNEVRKQLAEKYNLKYCTIIHKSAFIAEDVYIGEGSVIMPNTCINTGTNIGKHCIINTGAIIEHENVIENYVHISPKSVTAGNVHIGEFTHVGIGATVKNNINITNNVVIGAGATVVKNIEESGTYVGIPAKRMN